MFLNAKNGIVQLTDDTMHYIRFGKGKKTLVMLPGLGDGITTVKGKALPMGLMYHAFAKNHTVYMFSRRNHLPKGHSTRDMAHDLKDALDRLGVGKMDLVGVSMGGMIAQHFAADFPDRVGKLVLVVTSAQPNETLNASIAEWISHAKAGDHVSFMDSNVRRMYSESYYRKNKWLVPIAGRLTKPKSYERFFIQADACLSHNAMERLPFISAPTLVLGGEQDRSLSPDASRDIAAALPRAQLKMYPQWGHGLYEEAKDFIPAVLAFVNN